MCRKLFITRYNHGEDDPESGIKKVTEGFFRNPTNGFTAEELNVILALKPD